MLSTESRYKRNIGFLKLAGQTLIELDRGRHGSPYGPVDRMKWAKNLVIDNNRNAWRENYKCLARYLYLKP